MSGQIAFLRCQSKEKCLSIANVLSIVENFALTPKEHIIKNIVFKDLILLSKESNFVVFVCCEHLHKKADTILQCLKSEKTVITGDFSSDAWREGPSMSENVKRFNLVEVEHLASYIHGNINYEKLSRIHRKITNFESSTEKEKPENELENADETQNEDGSDDVNVSQSTGVHGDLNREIYVPVLEDYDIYSKRSLDLNEEVTEAVEGDMDVLSNTINSGNVVVLRCFLQDRCTWASDLHKSLEQNGFVTTDHILEIENMSKDSVDIVRSSDFIVVVLCRHLEQNLRKIKRFLQEFSSKVIISGDLNGIQTRQIFDGFKLFKTTQVSALTSYMRQTIDDHRETDPITPKDQISRTSKMISDPNYHDPLDCRTQQVSIPPTDYDYDQAYNTSRGPTYSKERNIHQSTGFLKACSLEQCKECTGTLVNAQECFPSVLRRSESIDHLKRQFYTVNGNEKTDLIRQIQTMTIASLRNSSDFLGLITLLGIAEYNIQEKVIDVLNHLHLEDNIMNRCLRCNQLLTAAKWLISIVKSNYGDSHIVTKILPVTCDSVAMLYLATLTITELSDELKSEIEHFISEACLQVQNIASTNIGDTKDTLSSLISALYLLLMEFKTRVGISKSLKIGNLKDALFIYDNRLRLLDHFCHSMCFLEQYACLCFVANQVLNTHDSEIVEFFYLLVQKLLHKAKKKQKMREVLYSALYLITKTVVFKIEKESEVHKTSLSTCWKLAKTLNLFLDSDRIPGKQSSGLLALIEPLLLISDQQIVVHTVYLFRRHNISTESIRKLFFNVVSKSVRVLNFKILNDEFTLKDSFKPNWMELTGSIFDERTVSLVVLTPTLSCLSKGDLDEYLRKAEKKETENYLNTLKILHYLQQSLFHSNIMQLFAFQRRPIPIFYVIEKAKSPDFLSYLLDRRTSSASALNRRQQMKYALDIINAVLFIHEKKIIHRNLTCSAFSVRQEAQTLFLHDFSISTRALTENGIISDLEDIGIPVLWSAPVSILEDRYDRRTDAWMLGNVIYELFTYGCHPYTEVYNTPTEQILEYVLFSDLKLHKWPCIPSGVYSVIQGLTISDPSERLDISAAQIQFQRMLHIEEESNQGESSDFTIEDFARDDLPQLDVNQGLPETDIPYLIQQMKNKHGRSISSAKHVYLNTRLSQRLQRGCLAITLADVTPEDRPRVTKRFGFLEVREAVTLKFLRFLPNIDDVEVYRDLLCLLNSPQKHIIQAKQKLTEHKFPLYLKYRCIKGKNILDFAFSNALGDPTSEQDQYLEIVLKIVTFVQEVHRRRLILGDICAEHLYISEVCDKVYMPRLGRMLYNDDQECAKGPIYSDRKRWNPIEVQQHGQYSSESDIYRLAMTVYEFYTALDIHKRDPMADQLNCAPFAHIPHKDLADVLYNGSVPARPKLCPDWLYEILVKCWDRDRTQRPSAVWIKETINRQLGDPLTDIDHSLFTMQLDVEVSEALPPEIPPRPSQAHECRQRSEDSNFLLSSNTKACVQSGQTYLNCQRRPSNNARRVTLPPRPLDNTNNDMTRSHPYENTSESYYLYKGKTNSMYDTGDRKHSNVVNDHIVRKVGTQPSINYDQTSIERQKSSVLGELQMRITPRMYTDEIETLDNNISYDMVAQHNEQFV